jgi:hypothetical protein
MLYKIYNLSVLKELHDLLSVLRILIRSDPVLYMVSDPVPDMVPFQDLFRSNRDLQNDAVCNTDLTKVAIANTE